MPQPSGPTTLYRLFSCTGDLLYVGIAGNPGRRFEQHAEDKPWWSSVVDIQLEHFPEREDARAAELRAIRFELPAFNKADVPADGRWVDELRPGTAQCWPDHCDRCRDADRVDWGDYDSWVHYPVRAYVEGELLTGYYRCRHCGNTWTCCYTWRDAEFRAA